MKRIVVFFPSWRYFGHFALPLFEPLAGQFEIVFFHTEKAIYGWDDCPDLADKGIEAVDLQSLNTFSLVKALKKLRPDCVVVFDKGWVQDRALLHATKHLGIPSLHIQHGIIARLEGVETKNTLKRICAEFLKIIRTFRLYDATLIHVETGAWFKSLPFQLRLLLNPNNYYYNHRHETTANLACIIGERDRAFFVEKEGYRDEQLVPLGALQFEKAYALVPHDPEPRMLLVSQPLFEDHVLDGGLSAKKKHIYEIIEASPLPVAVKPHPREDRQWYLENFQSSELLVYPSEKDINEAIQECSHVVGYFSTALINALILKRPVGIVRWVEDAAYVLNLDADGAAVRLDRPEDVNKMMEPKVEQVNVGYYAYNTNVQQVLAKTLGQLV